MLENELVSFELAIKLKELGYPQGKSYFEYDDSGNIFQHNPTIEYSKELKYYDAPSVTEILKELPNKIFYNFGTLAYGLVMSVSRDSFENFIVGYYRRNMKETCFEVREEKLVDALARVWIWLSKDRGDKEEKMEESCKNCKHLIKLYKYPCNKIKMFNGSTMEESGIYACLLFKTEDNGGIVFEEHIINGQCECWEVNNGNN